MKDNLKLLSLFIRRAAQILSPALVFKKPLLLPRTLRIAFIYLFTKKNVPWDANIAITSACNLNCEHCFARTFGTTAREDKNKQQLTTQELVAVIKEQLALGVINFDLQGGEVFCHDDLEEIIKACAPHKSYVSIITNGTFLTEEVARRLKSLGVDQIVVSIDSGLPEEHDAFRRAEGTWESAVAAVDTALKCKLKVTVNTTVTHESLYSEGFNKVVEFCKTKNVINWLFIGIPVGNWSGHEDVLINEEDHEYMARLGRESKNMIRRDISPHLFRSGCPAVKEGVYMTPYGDILPCPFIHISLGNVRDHTVKDIVSRGLEVKEFREHSAVCLIGEDREFIQKYGAETFNSPSIPVDGEDLFEFENSLPPRPVPLGCEEAE